MVIEYITQNLFVLTVSGVIVAGVYIISKLIRKISRVEDNLDSLREDVDELQIETHAFEDQPVDNEEDLFQKNIHELAQRLFNLLKSKHDVKGVTTYQEMTDFIKDMDVDDEKLKDELLDFYDSATILQYSDEELSETEREKMKKNAVDLIKRTGQNLEGQE